MRKINHRVQILKHKLNISHKFFFIRERVYWNIISFDILECSYLNFKTCHYRKIHFLLLHRKYLWTNPIWAISHCYSTKQKFCNLNSAVLQYVSVWNNRRDLIFKYRTQECAFFKYIYMCWAVCENSFKYIVKEKILLLK